MSANPVFKINELTHDELSERVVFLALAGETDSFEWHCLDQEVHRRLAEDYADRDQPAGQPGRFRPVLVVNMD